MSEAGERGERTFEELSRELEEIVARLERGDVGVDDAIALFTRGEDLHKAWVERLEVPLPKSCCSSSTTR